MLEPRLDLVKHHTRPHRILPPGREITFKTDPEKGDYELETGASRNFESWTDKQATEKEHKEARYGSGTTCWREKDQARRWHIPSTP